MRKIILIFSVCCVSCMPTKKIPECEVTSGNCFAYVDTVIYPYYNEADNFFMRYTDEWKKIAIDGPSKYIVRDGKLIEYDPLVEMLQDTLFNRYQLR